MTKCPYCNLEFSGSIIHNCRKLKRAVTLLEGAPAADPVNHPSHYTSHPSGVECIAITEHMNFCLGNAVKYIWRASLKHTSPVEDLKKARWYIDRELSRLERGKEE